MIEIDESIRVLWQGVLNNNYVHSLDQITSDVSRQALLTSCFVKWFYETLESYRHELNFFGGTATLEWFREANSNYKANRKFDKKDHGGRSRETHTYVQNEQSHLVAILKPKTSTEKSDWLVSLSAKATGLIDVINPAIPVRIADKGLVIDAKNFTHIVEPFVGFNSNEIEKTSLMGQLLRNILDANPTQKADKNASLHLYNFARYFEHGKNPANQRFDDLQTFNTAIDIENIVKIIMFWRMFGINDMHDSNILLRVKSDGKLSLVVIDYNRCYYTSPQSDPSLFVLKHATKHIDSGLVQKISERISYESIRRVYKAYSAEDQLTCSRPGGEPSVEYQMKYFIYPELQKFSRQSATVRGIMWELFKDDTDRAYQLFKKKYPLLADEDGSLKIKKFYIQISLVIGEHISPYWPLDIRPLGEVREERKKYVKDECYGEFYVNFPKLIDSTPIRPDLGDYPTYQVRQSPYDLVFSVADVSQLEKGLFFKSTIASDKGDIISLRIWHRGMFQFPTLFDPRHAQILPSL